MQALELLGHKLDLLLKKLTALQAENSRLQALAARQEAENEALQQRLQDLEQRLLAVQTGQFIADDADRERVRRQLDTVIAEIDKMLSSLHD